VRVKPPKIADQAIFYLTNSVEPKVRSTPDNRDFCGTGGAKIHKCNRLLVELLPLRKVVLPMAVYVLPSADQAPLP
jgi:hypothetical protein